jgi:hypothetical protein
MTLSAPGKLPILPTPGGSHPFLLSRIAEAPARVRNGPGPPGFEPVPIGKVPSRALIGYRTPTLDLLLAALIDNTTGGANAVNGTLE